MHTPPHLRVALCTGALFLVGCGGNGRRPAFLVPVQQQVPADRITLTGTAPDGTATVTANDVAAFVGADRRYWARNVPLTLGENRIEVVARDANGRELRREAATVVGVGGPDPVRVALDPPAGPPPLPVRLRVASPLDVVEAQFDFQGDGQVDAVGAELEVEHVYADAGRYPPQVTIRTRSGLHFSSLPASPIAPDPLVLVLPEASVVGSVALEAPERVLVDASGALMVLSRRTREVVTLAADLTPRRRTALRGVDDPSGLAIDRLGRFLTCDVTQHRLVRLDRNGNLDLAFNFRGYVGEAGNEPLQFQRPSDVVLDEADDIYVADTGNQRIQKLNQEGVFVAQFAVAGEPQRLAYRNGGLHYSLAGSRELAVMDVLGVERNRLVAAGPGAVRCLAVLPTRGLLATTTDDSPTIWLQGPGGQNRRALRLGEVTDPRHIALAARPDRLELVVLDASGRVLRVEVPEDDAAATPDNVVSTMLQRLAADDVEGALALFDTTVRANYRRQFAALSPEQRASLPSTIRVGAVREQSDQHAEVAVVAELGGQSQDEVVGLGRDAQTFAWRIQSF